MTESTRGYAAVASKPTTRKVALLLPEVAESDTITSPEKDINMLMLAARTLLLLAAAFTLAGYVATDTAMTTYSSMVTLAERTRWA